MKIIYIAGDGRSGSTILDSILSNADGTLSVGECYRFWKRFYEADTLCGCGDPIETCTLWHQVDLVLKRDIPGYDPKEMWQKITYLLKFKQIPQIEEILSEPGWQTFKNAVILFYQTIVEHSGKSVLIDSSKSPGWLNVIRALKFCDLRIIHLERSLPAVANSWKKQVALPEYYDKEVMMPIKSNGLIVKTWLKIKLLLRRLRNEDNYLFLRYSDFIAHPKEKLEAIVAFSAISLSANEYYVKPNHSIGGNPMRTNTRSIAIYTSESSPKNLSLLERFCFSVIDKISRLFL
ncbi:MAG: sulfotransferase [Bacteroidota bacterium]